MKCSLCSTYLMFPHHYVGFVHDSKDLQSMNELEESYKPCCHFYHSFQNLPEEAIPVAVEKYLRHTDDPDRNKDQLLELIGDVIFGVPSVIVSRGHRGESLRLDKRTLILPLCSVTGLYPNICKCATAKSKHLDIVLFNLCQYCLWISLKCNGVKGVDPRKYELVQKAVTEEGPEADTQLSLYSLDLGLGRAGKPAEQGDRT